MHICVVMCILILLSSASHWAVVRLKNGALQHAWLFTVNRVSRKLTSANAKMRLSVRRDLADQSSTSDPI